jgi:Leucine-rich repeat (LRR) protein
MELPSYLRYHEQSLDIFDAPDPWPELPDDFFDTFPGLTRLSISMALPTRLPASFDRLRHLQSLSIRKTKLRQLPDSLFSMPLQHLLVQDNNLIDFDKEAPRLAGLKDLASLELGGYKGSAFPSQLKLITSLVNLELSNERKNSMDLPAILDFIQQLPAIKRLTIKFPRGGNELLITEDNLKILDRLEQLSGWGWGQMPANQLPLAMGLTKKVTFSYRFDVIISFRDAVAGKDYSPFQLQLLFGLFVGNFAALTDWLPNRLTEATQKKEKINLRLLDKPKGESLSSINNRLAEFGIKADNSADDDNTLFVVGAATAFDQAGDLVSRGRPMITVDQLQRFLISRGEHWLLEEQNAGVQDQLLRLLASNQPDSYRLAFQMIATGGADKTIQSVLAAIMLSHPDKDIHRSAERLYGKFGSQSFTMHLRPRRINLRTGGDIERKLAQTIDHPDIDPFVFRLMYHRIAGSNDKIRDVDEKVFQLKGVSDFRLPASIVCFTQIAQLHFEDCKGLDVQQLIDVVQQMPACTTLVLNGCHVVIPPEIGKLTQLQRLEIAHNELPQPDILGRLTSLQTLNVEGIRITGFGWLRELPDLRQLNLNSNRLQQLPEELYTATALQRLEAKQNKLTAVPERLLQLTQLRHLDLSNNQITAFPSFLAAHPALKELLLRSNKIGSVPIDSMPSDVRWELLNLSRNQILELRFPPGMRHLKELDISENQLKELDESLFPPSISSFYASSNLITTIPRVLGKTTPFKYLWLRDNCITELPDYFSHTIVQNCDLSNNRIASIHPDFDKNGIQPYGRLYWKLDNNPLPKGKIGGMYV